MQTSGQLSPERRQQLMKIVILLLPPNNHEPTNGHCDYFLFYILLVAEAEKRLAFNYFGSQDRGWKPSL